MSQLDRVSGLDRRQVLKIFGAIAAAGATGAAAGCSSELEATPPEQPSGRTIGIGLISPTVATGAYARVGDDIQKGFKLYLKDNANLLGLHTVDLKMAEEGTSGTSGQAAVKSLLDQGVIAIAGVASPDVLKLVAPALVEAKVPLVAASVAPLELTPLSYLWRVSNVEGEAGRALAPYARSLFGEVKAYVMCEETENARREAAEFRDALVRLGGQVVSEQVGTPANFNSRLQAAKNTSNIIFAAFTGNGAAALLDAYKVSNIPQRLIGPGTLTETVDLSKVPNLSDNVYTSMYYAADLDNEANRRFVSSYYKEYGIQPSGHAMAAYDSASVLNKALRLVEGAPTGVDLNKAFSLLGQIESPRGFWTFNTNRGPQQRWYLRRLRKDGQVVGNMLDADLEVLS